jgi:hypothetical protein
MCALWGRWFGLRFSVTKFCWDGYGRIDSVGTASCSVAEYCSSEVCCCTCRPPCVPQAIKEADTLL